MENKFSNADTITREQWHEKYSHSLQMWKLKNSNRRTNQIGSESPRYNRSKLKIIKIKIL